MAKRVLNAGNYVTATCNKYDKFEKPVQAGLALTPRKVRELTDRGVAVSTPNQNYMDSEFSNSPFVEPQYRRGCDLNTAWEISRRVTSKLVNVHKIDKRKFGG